MRHEFLDRAFAAADHAAASQQRSQQRRHDAVNVEQRHRCQRAIRGVQGEGPDHGVGAGEKVGVGERHDLRSRGGAGRLEHEGHIVGGRCRRQNALAAWHRERIHVEKRQLQCFGSLHHGGSRLIIDHDSGDPESDQVCLDDLSQRGLRDRSDRRRGHPREEGYRTSGPWCDRKRKAITTADSMVREELHAVLHGRRQFHA